MDAAKEPARACGSVRIYDSQNGCLVDVPIVPCSESNQSFPWAVDSKWFFILSRDAIIYCLDVSNRTVLSQWLIHNRSYPKCIALAPNGRLIAAAAATSVSFWDTKTHKKIGSVIEHVDSVGSMAISENDDIMTSARTTITLMQLCDILPSCYLDVVSASKFSYVRYLPIHHSVY